MVSRPGDAHRVEVLVEPEVRRIQALPFLARGRRAEHHRHRRVHRVGHADVRVRQQEEHHGARLRLGERVFAGTALRPAAPGRLTHRAPVLRVVAVQVEAADAVLVHATVAIVVHAFGKQEVVALPCAHAAHQAPALVQGVHDRITLAGPDMLAQLHDEAVAVEVFGRILIEQAVAVVIVRAYRAAVGLRGQAVHVAAVGVVHRPDVDGACVEQRGDVRVLAVVLDEVPGQVERALGGGDLARVATTFKERGRFIGVLPRLLAGKRQLPDVTATERLPDGVQVHEVRMVLGPLPHPLLDLDAGVVVPEVHLAGDHRLHLVAVGQRKRARAGTHAGDDKHVGRARRPLGAGGAALGDGGQGGKREGGRKETEGTQCHSGNPSRGDHRGRRGTAVTGATRWGALMLDGYGATAKTRTCTGATDSTNSSIVTRIRATRAVGVMRSSLQ